jgi:membrane-bound lytic murein transglycosylase D
MRPAAILIAGTMSGQMRIALRLVASIGAGLLAGLALAAQPALAASADPFVNLSGFAPARALGAAATQDKSPNPRVAKLLAHPASLWDRIRNGYAIPGLKDDPVVARYERWWAEHPERLGAILRRGRKYLYFIVERLERRGMPLERRPARATTSCRTRRSTRGAT